MKVFVCIKQVPDTESKIKLKGDASGIDTAGIKWVMNPYDEFAVEEAIKLKESGKASNVTVVSLGPKARIVDALRTAMAMGADDAIAIDAPEDTDAFLAGRALAAAIKTSTDPFLLVLTGKLAIDDNASTVSQVLAESLGLPHATVISKLEVTDQTAIAEREIEGGSREILQLKLPAVIAANKGLNMPRYASLPGIMKAKKKPILEMDLGSLSGATAGARVRHQNFKLPPEKPAAKMLSGDLAAQAHELARLLREEAKVI